MTDTDALLTVKEYAALFRRHHATVYTAIRQDRLPYPVERPTGSDYVLIRVPEAVVARLRRTDASTRTQTR